MYEFLIKEYVERLTKDDVIKFAKKSGISLEEEEVTIIHTYMKKHWRTFYYGNPKELLDELNGKLKPETYIKLEQLYIQLKNKIS